MKAFDLAVAVVVFQCEMAGITFAARKKLEETDPALYSKHKILHGLKDNGFDADHQKRTHAVADFVAAFTTTKRHESVDAELAKELSFQISYLTPGNSERLRKSRQDTLKQGAPELYAAFKNLTSAFAEDSLESRASAYVSTYQAVYAAKQNAAVQSKAA